MGTVRATKESKLLIRGLLEAMNLPIFLLKARPSINRQCGIPVCFTFELQPNRYDFFVATQATLSNTTTLTNKSSAMHARPKSRLRVGDVDVINSGTGALSTVIVPVASIFPA